MYVCYVLGPRTTDPPSVGVAVCSTCTGPVLSNCPFVRLSVRSTVRPSVRCTVDRRAVAPFVRPTVRPFVRLSDRLTVRPLYRFVLPTRTYRLTVCTVRTVRLSVRLFVRPTSVRRTSYRPRSDRPTVRPFDCLIVRWSYRRTVYPHVPYVPSDCPYRRTVVLFDRPTV